MYLYRQHNTLWYMYTCFVGYDKNLSPKILIIVIQEKNQVALFSDSYNHGLYLFFFTTNLFFCNITLQHKDAQKYLILIKKIVRTYYIAAINFNQIFLNYNSRLRRISYKHISKLKRILKLQNEQYYILSPHTRIFCRYSYFTLKHKRRKKIKSSFYMFC